MAVAVFDKLNVISTKVSQTEAEARSMPYEEYFGEMELDDEEKRRRINVAEKIELVLLFVFSFVATLGEMAENYRDYIIEQFQKQYQSALAPYMDVDFYTRQYIENITESIVNTTLFNMGSTAELADNYYLSDDRAMYVAENEANSVMNYRQFQEALKQGYRKKKWRTMKDKLVRKTHRQVDDEVKGIRELFHVGESLMLFPKDTSQGASIKEIIGCRCSVEYLK